MSYVTARAEVAELAIDLLEEGESKSDMYSVFQVVATILLTCNDEMVREELKKLKDQ